MIRYALPATLSLLVLGVACGDKKKSKADPSSNKGSYESELKVEGDEAIVRQYVGLQGDIHKGQHSVLSTLTVLDPFVALLVDSGGTESDAHSWEAGVPVAYNDWQESRFTVECQNPGSTWLELTHVSSILGELEPLSVEITCSVPDGAVGTCDEDGAYQDEGFTVMLDPDPEASWGAMVDSNGCQTMMHQEFYGTSGERILQLMLEAIGGGFHLLEQEGQVGKISHNGAVIAANTFDGTDWFWRRVEADDQGVPYLGAAIAPGNQELFLSADGQVGAYGGYGQAPTIVYPATGETMPMPGLPSGIFYVEGLDATGQKALVNTTEPLDAADTDTDADCYTVDLDTGAVDFVSKQLPEDENLSRCIMGSSGFEIMVQSWTDSGESAVYTHDLGALKERVRSSGLGETAIDGPSAILAYTEDGDLRMVDLETDEDVAVSWDDLVDQGQGESFSAYDLKVVRGNILFAASVRKDGSYQGDAVIRYRPTF